jgi:deoxyribonuclease (pyrimidine dimer)
MVRVNLIDPKALSDQHLIAEYDEILMLVGYVRRYPSLDDLPKRYALGKGHIRFFKDKLLYLSYRHARIKDEMARRGFVCRKSVDLEGFDDAHLNDWRPLEDDLEIIKDRIIAKLRMKPGYYRYFRKSMPSDALVSMVMGASV